MCGHFTLLVITFFVGLPSHGDLDTVLDVGPRRESYAITRATVVVRTPGLGTVAPSASVQPILQALSLFSNSPASSVRTNRSTKADAASASPSNKSLAAT